MVESNVAISPDTSQAGSHNIRTITVQPDNSAVVAGGQSEQQQVVTLGDSKAGIVDLIHGAVPVASEELATLMKAMLVRFDILCHLIDRGYTPPDQLGL